MTHGNDQLSTPIEEVRLITEDGTIHRAFYDAARRVLFTAEGDNIDQTGQRTVIRANTGDPLGAFDIPFSATPGGCGRCFGAVRA